MPILLFILGGRKTEIEPQKKLKAYALFGLPIVFRNQTWSFEPDRVSRRNPLWPVYSYINSRQSIQSRFSVLRTHHSAIVPFLWIWQQYKAFSCLTQVSAIPLQLNQWELGYRNLFLHVHFLLLARARYSEYTRTVQSAVRFVSCDWDYCGHWLMAQISTVQLNKRSRLHRTRNSLNFDSRQSIAWFQVIRVPFKLPILRSLRGVSFVGSIYYPQNVCDREKAAWLEESQTEHSHILVVDWSISHWLSSRPR